MLKYIKQGKDGDEKGCLKKTDLREQRGRSRIKLQEREKKW